MLDYNVLEKWLHDRIEEVTKSVAEVIKNKTFCGLPYIMAQESAWREVIDLLETF